MPVIRQLILALCIALILPAGSALAACEDDLKLVKEQYKNVRDTRKRDLLKKEISAADTALKHKSQANCKRSVMNAQRILKQKP